MKQLIAGLVLGLGLLQGAQADVQTYSFTVPANSTYFTDSNNWAPFDTSLGTLTGISISYNLATQLNYSVVNNGSVAIDPVNLTVQGGYLSVILRTPVFPYSIVNFAQGFSGEYSFALAPGETYSNSLTADISGGVGPKGIDLPYPMEMYASGLTTSFEVVTPYLSVGARNPRNLSFDVTAQDAHASISLNYIYDAAPVPEPENYAMLLAGLCLIGVMVGRSKNL